MKPIILIALTILLVIPVYAVAAVIAPARVNLVDGEVMLRAADADDWMSVSANTSLDEGDALWCPVGTKAEVQLPDGSIVRLDGDSQLNLVANEDNFIHLNLASGRLYLKTSPYSTPNSLQIDADDTTVLPAPRTRLRLDMLANSQEDVSIFKGSAYVEGNGNRTKVRAGEHIALEEWHSELLPLNAPDNWETWNMDRDRLQSPVAKTDATLPDELRSYSTEMEANGIWVRIPEYGMVWRPTVILSDEWAPYRSGRWIWKGSDYVWISSESWGWAPYHYGRWTVVSNYGWCWIPPVRGDVYWGPGYVGWYRNGNHVGWTPLAPGEIYYGYGNHGRQSVNISTAKVNINSVDYRNSHHRGGLTVLPQQDFLRGVIVTSHAAVNSPVSIPVAVGSPRIRPVKDAHSPVGRQTAPKMTVPPAPRIEQRKNSELRQRFPRVIPQTDSRQQSQQAPPGINPQKSVPEQHVKSPPSAPQQTNIQPGEMSRQRPAQREQKQKKIWRVKTPEGGRESDSKIIEHKNKERKDKQ